LSTDAILPDQGGTDGKSEVAPSDLKRKAAHGALISTGAQVGMFAVRTGSLMVMARLLLTQDFGLVNMVTAFTGFLGLLRDAGLSMAAVQRESITVAQKSTLFWINLALGLFLTSLVASSAPVLSRFYGEPRLFWVTVVLGTGFIFHAAGAQHRALLQRSMRFTALAIIDTGSAVASIAVGIIMALAGYGYWSLVAMMICPPVASLPGLWLATKWVPGMPQRGLGIRSMLAYGGAVTLNNIIFYIAYNADKVLVGRFWGAEALGLYGRAYQIINLPTENLNSTVGLVAFPALSRLQNDPVRFKSYFLQGYNLYLSLVVPITWACALFADNIILVVLGPKWHGTAPILRLLAPTIFAFAILNAFGWLMLACGRAGRNLAIAVALTPILLFSYWVGLQYGPQGVAIGFSVTMILATLPIVLWAKSDTLIRMKDVFRAASPSLASILLATIASLAFRALAERMSPPIARLAAECSVLFGVYVLSLLFLMKQKPVYARLLQEIGIRRPSPGSSPVGEKP
jgi:O-antigen/teichoic acid export membrane protein